MVLWTRGREVSGSKPIRSCLFFLWKAINGSFLILFGCRLITISRKFRDANGKSIFCIFSMNEVYINIAQMIVLIHSSNEINFHIAWLFVSYCSSNKVNINISLFCISQLAENILVCRISTGIFICYSLFTFIKTARNTPPLSPYHTTIHLFKGAGKSTYI